MMHCTCTTTAIFVVIVSMAHRVKLIISSCHYFCAIQPAICRGDMGYLAHLMIICQVITTLRKKSIAKQIMLCYQFKKAVIIEQLITDLRILQVLNLTLYCIQADYRADHEWQLCHNVLRHRQCTLFYYCQAVTFTYLLRLYSTSAEGLQDTKSYSLLKMLRQLVCLKSCRQEKKFMMYQDSLEPAHFILPRLKCPSRQLSSLKISINILHLTFQYSLDHIQ